MGLLTNFLGVKMSVKYLSSLAAHHMRAETRTSHTGPLLKWGRDVSPQ